MSDDHSPFEFLIFDLDGTLCNIDHRVHLARSKQWDEFHQACRFDPPRLAEVAIAQAWTHSGPFRKIICCTGRSDIARRETLIWLNNQRILVRDLFMRYQQDFTSDVPLKRGMLTHIRARYPNSKIVGVFEDRDKVVAMWREEGLTCFQTQLGTY